LLKYVSREDLSGIDTLEALTHKALTCHACGLRQTCSGVVVGEGSAQARLMLVGEAPGRQEDQAGRPFVGAAGQLLDKILAAASIQRSKVYVSNTVKCRPPGNRMPTPQERLTCFPWLVRQVELIQPAIIVCLGALAAQTILGSEIRITKDRGRVFQRKGKIIIPTFHPAALLRDPAKKHFAWDDFQLIRDYYLRIENQENLTLKNREEPS
jgi:uracil-DNA glycosylase